MGKRRNRSKHRTGQGPSGHIASWDQGTLQSYRVGAVPIINHLLQRWAPPTSALAVTVHCLREFHVNLDELHNDSTTVTFYGDYATAEREHWCHGRRTPAITFGHNKDHRPDLKHKAQLDAAARATNLRRGLQDLGQFRDKLRSPRTRYRDRTNRSSADLI